MKSKKPLGNALRLEIESDPAPGALTNLVKNPNGDLGGWAWITPVAGTALNGAPNAPALAPTWDSVPAATTWDSVPGTTTWDTWK